MAPTTLVQSSTEEGPNSHNIWDKTFQICDRLDSDASVIFTGKIVALQFSPCSPCQIKFP